MTVDRDLVLYLESLARIRLTEEERVACESDLQNIINYLDQLNALDTEGVEPMVHSLPLVNVAREDAVEESMDAEMLLANAPHERDGYLLVQRAVE